MTRILCVWSPNWAIANWIRRHPCASRGEVFALVGVIRGVRRLTAVDRGAAELGLFAGQKATDAAALVPEIVTAEADPAADARALTALADWCARFSPAVAVDAPDGLLLDISGAAHLWGGEAAMMADLAARLAGSGLAVRTAVAATAGAAWALAHFAADRAIAETGEEAAALADLPAAALRLTGEDAVQIARLGLADIGALAGLPRAQIGPRFGAGVLRRLDQALGRAGEALEFRRPPSPWLARLAFAEPISTPEDMARASADIAARLCARLEASGQGARRFDLALHRLDGVAVGASVGLALPGREAVRIARLFAPKLESLDPGFGVEVVTLAAHEVATLAPRQRIFPPLHGEGGSSEARDGWGGAPTPSGASRHLPHPGGGGFAADPEDLAPLVDRLVNRLGAEAVWRAEAFPSHAPERAVTRRPPLSPPDGPGWREGLPRPVRLFARPEPIEVIAPVPDDPPVQFRWRGRRHRVRRAEGPERLAQEWWRRPFEAADPAHARDYYQVEDEAGGRFWLFRAGLYDPDVPPRWWLHGLFG